MSENVNDVKPFRAYHYNHEKIKNIGDCLSQPYDVISGEMQDKYYRQHENNIVRLILNKKEEKDTEENNRYTRALGLLKEWRESDVLHLTSRESFYVYEQEYSLPRAGKLKVKGFIGRVRLREYEEKRVLPHEKVLKKPVEDRIQLTRATNTQFEYIWGLYQDERNIIDTILLECENDVPIINYYEEPYGVRHRLWRLTDAEKCNLIEKAMSEEKIYIADGHHRYQTMLNIREEMRKTNPDAGPDAPWEYIMMYLVNSAHEGLTVLPTHRMVHDLQNTDWDATLENLKNYFDIAEFTFTGGNEAKARRNWLNTIEELEHYKHRFGLYINGKDRYFVLSLSDADAYLKLMNTEASLEWKMLDVNIVNNLIFKEILGITEEQLSLNSHTAYTQETDNAIEKVKEGGMQACIILNNTPLKSVLTISDNSEKMPRKSTFFFPKPVSGLVMYPMDLK
ncbi:MAG: DUF1015 domain-containing protein [Spirochaetales bacterium]|nr:DUF1015 domain-containing protein [Spirochaetales bacterium]